jgi:uncharacterized protein (TIGR02117 family)
VLLAAVVLAAGCAAPGPDRAPATVEPSLAVWVVDHGWHTAVVVRRADVDPAIWPEVRDFPDSVLVEIAWGDRDFYMATDPTAWLAVKAALFTVGSVVHVAGFGRAVVPASAVELRVSRGGFDAMTRFFHDEYVRDVEGRPARLAPGLYGASWFYLARSRYHLFNTCNTWVARALREAGLDITPAGTVTAGDVMEQVRRAAVAR